MPLVTDPTHYSGCGCTLPGISFSSVGTQAAVVYGSDAAGNDYCEDCFSQNDHEDCDCDSCRESREDYGNSGEYSRALRIAAEVSRMPVEDLPNMLIPNLKRSISCEFETTAGGDLTSSALDNLENGTPHEHRGDSTCDDELIFYRLRLEDGMSAERYGRSLALIQRLKDEGMVSVGPRAGHHIHVSAVDNEGRCFTPNALVTLYSVYSHLEDLLYRLAAAGWRRHRTEDVGGFANSIPQLGRAQKKTPKTVGMAIANDRYYGLNVTRFIGAMARCSCGAQRFGVWAECECGDEGKTIEWRLWNSAVSARKIRTYIVISHAITEYAATHTTDGHADLEPNLWTGTDSVDEDSLSRQIAFLSSLPGMTKRDREDIRWLVSISPGMGELGNMFAIPVSDYAGSNH